MSNLDVTEMKAGKLNKLEDSAIQILQGFVDGNRDCDEVVKGSLKIMNVVAKNRQTVTHRTAIEFGMATSIATEEQLRKYIEVTNPQVKKALAGK